MLAKKFRLPIDEFFSKEKKTGRPFLRKNKFFTLRAVPNNLPHSRFGVTISKKVDKSAVRRNSLKRTVFNFIRLQKINPTPGLDVLISILPTIGSLKRDEVENELADILKFING